MQLNNISQYVARKSLSRPDTRSAFLFVVAILLRGALFVTIQPSELLTRWCPVCTDALDYNQLALNLLRIGQYTLNNQMVAERPPLYPAFIAGIYAIAGVENFIAVRVIQIILSAITVLFISQIANRLFGYLASWIAGGMMAVYPFFIAYSIELYSETLFTFLVASAMLLLFPYPDRSSPSINVSFAGGLLIGLSALTRELGLMLLPAITLWFWFSQRRLWAGWLVVAWLAASLVVGSWTVRNYLTWNKLIPITTHTFTNVIHSLVDDHHYRLDGVQAEIPAIVPATVDNPFAYLAGVDQVAQEEYARSLALSYCSIKPMNCLTAWSKNFLKLVSPIIENRAGWIVVATSASHLSVYLLGVIGLIQIGRTSNKSLVFFLLCWFGLCLSLNSIAHVEIRYRIPLVDPYLIVMGSYPMANLFQRLSDRH